jgi:hypothetical protein
VFLFIIHDRAVRRVSFGVEFSPPASGLGRKKSYQSGFLPILPLIFCLLIYERQQRPNCATPIFLKAERKLAG